MTDMKFSSKWLMEKTEEEAGIPFSVGGWIAELEPFFSPQSSTSTMHSKALEAIPVFGNFVNLSRREKGWTVQQLAAKLNVAAESIVRLESGQSPQPMLVSKIAKVFDVPSKKLLQIAGHATANEAVANAAFAFAARSNTRPLDADQRAALKEFVQALVSK